jgi:hypothetical protein
MKKQFSATLAIASIALWLGALPVAAQGRGQGHGAGGASSSHEPMGMDKGMSHDTTTHGPKTAGELLMQNKNLSSKLAPLVGCTGPDTSTCVQNEAKGFRNLGQFVAAAHVSHNLDVPFACLKADMTGTALSTSSSSSASPTCPAGTGSKKLSLGDSIQALKPTMTSSEAKDAAKTATHEANDDISGS